MTQSSDMTREYREEDVLTFPRGLVGLPELKRWILVDMQPVLPMKWLQSLDRDGFRLPVTDPGFYAESYGFEIDDTAQKSIRVDDVDDIVVMIISTVESGGERITGNLSAPLIVNVSNRKGLQYIIEGADYGMKQEIDTIRFGEACQAYAAGHPENVVGTAVDKALAGRYDDEGSSEPSTRDPEAELVDVP